MATKGKVDKPGTETPAPKTPGRVRAPAKAAAAKPARPRPLRADAPQPAIGSSAPLTVLVLQGGGALGAYHLGVCEELSATECPPDWVAGISIGAINAALIAGNRPGERIGALRRFWELISNGLTPFFPIPDRGPMRDLWSESAAMWVAAMGIPGFFQPRLLPPMLHPPGTADAISFYDITPLRQTLENMIDFDYLNDGPIRISVGAINVTTGHMHFFDNRGGPDQTRITVDHILASGALPPGFPPVQIGEDWYWDGGLASNTPLQHVLDEAVDRDKNIFQVDLFPAGGTFPQTLLDTVTRQEDIRFSSRTRLNTNLNATLSSARQLLRRLRDACNPDLANLRPEELALLDAFAREPRVDIAQIIYRDKAYTGHARGMEFSRPAMEVHRAAGRRDARRTLAIRNWRQNPPEEGLHSFDPGQPDAIRTRKFAADT